MIRCGLRESDIAPASKIVVILVAINLSLRG
jgi:hypothetical protein